MHLTSPAFASGAQLPERFALAAANRSPPLVWTDVPPTARSLVVLCDDPDAPRGTWHHWALFDVPPSLDGVPEGCSGRKLRPTVCEAVNDFARACYDGPAPPRGHGVHHYHFRLLALDVERLPLGADPSCAEVEAAAAPHVLAEAELIGTFAR